MDDQVITRTKNSLARLALHVARITALINVACNESSALRCRMELKTSAGNGMGSELDELIPVFGSMSHEITAAWLGGEVMEGFPLMHGLGVIGICSMLEAFVEEVGPTWLLSESSAPRWQAKWTCDEVLAYGKMSPEARAQRLWDQVFRESTKALPTRFDDAFGAVGLKMTVDEDLRRSLLELYAVRNVIAHCGSVVDTRLCQGCPWASLHVGDQLLVPSEKLRGYAEAAALYASHVQATVCDRLGRTPDSSTHMASRLRGDAWRLAFGIARDPPSYE